MAEKHPEQQVSLNLDQQFCHQLIRLLTLIPEEEIVARGYARDRHDDSDEEWEMEGQDETRSAFDIFDDVNDDAE